MELSEAEWKQIVLLAWDEIPCLNCNHKSCQIARHILMLNGKHYPKSWRTWKAYVEYRRVKDSKEV